MSIEIHVRNILDKPIAMKKSVKGQTITPTRCEVSDVNAIVTVITQIQFSIFCTLFWNLPICGFSTPKQQGFF